MEDDLSLGRTVVLGSQISAATLQLTVGRLYAYNGPAMSPLQAYYWPATGRAQALYWTYVGLILQAVYWLYMGCIQTGTNCRICHIRLAKDVTKYLK